MRMQKSPLKPKADSSVGSGNPKLVCGPEVRFEDLCARVSAQLAREDAGRYMHVGELSRHAITIARSALAVRRSLDEGKGPGRHLAALRRVAQIFRADAAVADEPEGVRVGLTLSSGQFPGHFFPLS